MSEYLADIYVLFSGRNGIVRYVGETSHTCAKRFEGHKREAQPRLRKWFVTEWKAGYPVECIRLEECDYEVRHKRETFWMQKFPASNLLNERKIYPWLHQRQQPTIREITAYRHRYLFNVGGYRGICYDQHWDCFQVLTFSGGRSAEWLFGDEADEMLPGWGGDMYFADRTRALIARDNERRWKRTWMLPDFTDPEF